MDWLKNLSFTVALVIVGACIFVLGLSGGIKLGEYQLDLTEALPRFAAGIVGLIIIGVGAWIEFANRSRPQAASLEQIDPQSSSRPREDAASRDGSSQTSRPMVGFWDSWWGPSSDHSRDGVLKNHETIHIVDQEGYNIRGTSVVDGDSRKLWEVVGRCDGHYLQLYYYPSPASPDPDFLDYGVYFLVKRAGGDYEGFSAGYGDNPDTHIADVSTDNHYIKRQLR
jgi:hypothetical protein